MSNKPYNALSQLTYFLFHALGLYRDIKSIWYDISLFMITSNSACANSNLKHHYHVYTTVLSGPVILDLISILSGLRVDLFLSDY